MGKAVRQGLRGRGKLQAREDGALALCQVQRMNNAAQRRGFFDERANAKDAQDALDLLRRRRQDGLGDGPHAILRATGWGGRCLRGVDCPVQQTSGSGLRGFEPDGVICLAGGSDCRLLGESGK